nr:hypothetical protein [Tanacetum cinerariifolium]
MISSAKATDQTECHKYGKKGHFARDYWSKKSVPSYQSPFQPKLLHSFEHKPEPRHTKDFEAKYNKVKAKLAFLSSIASVPISSSSKNKDNVSITDSNKPRLSEAKNYTLSNHDTGKKSSIESQRNTTDLSVVVTESSATSYDSADEASVCSTPLPLLKKLDGAEPVSGPKTIKSILKSKSTFKAETIKVCSTLLPPLKKLDGAEPVSGPKTIKSILKSKSTFKAETIKGIILNEPSLTPARGNKSSLAFKTNSAPAGKLKNVKIEDDPSLAIVMK